VNLEERRGVAQAEIRAGEDVTASFEGTFVVVEPPGWDAV
jgi:hypothetical protein